MKQDFQKALKIARECDKFVISLHIWAKWFGSILKTHRSVFLSLNPHRIISTISQMTLNGASPRLLFWRLFDEMELCKHGHVSLHYSDWLFVMSPVSPLPPPSPCQLIYWASFQIKTVEMFLGCWLLL